MRQSGQQLLVREVRQSGTLFYALGQQFSHTHCCRTLKQCSTDLVKKISTAYYFKLAGPVQIANTE